jgi:hypothetical protein
MEWGKDSFEPEAVTEVASHEDRGSTEHHLEGSKKEDGCVCYLLAPQTNRQALRDTSIRLSGPS